METAVKLWKEMILSAADLFSKNAEELSRIDSVIGDGDHGVTIAKIAGVMTDTAKLDFETRAEFLDDLGWKIVNVQGGSAGPLIGTFISGMGSVEGDAKIGEIFSAGLESLREISGAKVGDKTMMDAIIPAVEAMNAEMDDASAVRAGAAAAKEGADRTKDFVAKFGRAKNYGEQSIGVKDAGACSMALFFEGMYKGYFRANDIS